MMLMMTDGKFSTNEMGSNVSGAVHQPSSDAIIPEPITTSNNPRPTPTSTDKDIALVSSMSTNTVQDVQKASSLANDSAFVPQSLLSESDSDAIPDIVDGDPDTD
jgi:hypothetical protein